ncbi:PaaI family thioesterase [Enterococcus saccharolyticus]|uniref:Aromatic compound catabolic protein n=1 Tax=Candidatus Enterococcus willemsii TaxID=1857215 RepID=A0ABQ6YW23_9ENTE|nr:MULTISPECIES: PaaI family thioesterase [Enterococcus]KAF1301540.1 aromatic compound catabolic protein [Enterococcus sp. CU12B]MCD5003178.1 PaaI family thioesterase [Enterococcus saccharolyticus]
MNLLTYLGIQTQEITPEKVSLTLTISDTHHQPFGYLHGGISGVLIETACSIGANHHVDDQSFAVGVDLHVSHLSAIQYGELLVEATPEKIGGRMHFWQAVIWCGKQKIATGTCTLMINKKTLRNS